MTKVLVGLLTLVVLLASYPVGKTVVDTVRSNQITSEEKNDSALEQVIPKLKDLLTQSAPKVTSVKNTLILEAKNTYVFRGPVMPTTVDAAIRQISKMSRNLAKSDAIYLVMDTPGGSVFDGADFIDFLEGIPQTIQTVTIFAASMGFQIVENNPGKRLIVRNGTLMSHRATLDGLGGQLDGELETRYRMIKRKIDYLETVDSKRMELTLEQYKAKIKDELWVHGFDSLDEKVADEMVLIRCGSTMVGTDVLAINTLFGNVNVVFDKCPLVKTPVSISIEQIRKDAKLYVGSIINDLFYDKVKFTKEIVTTGKFYKIFQ